MSVQEYLRTTDGRVVWLDVEVHAGWAAAANPKALVHLPIATDPVPPFDPATHAADPYLSVGPDAVVRGWNVRALTAEERRKTWTSYEFLNRFTAAERAEVRTGSATDPVLADFLMLATAAQEVVSDDPVTVNAMAYLVAVGVLTPARRGQILGESTA